MYNVQFFSFFTKRDPSRFNGVSNINRVCVCVCVPPAAWRFLINWT